MAVPRELRPGVGLPGELRYGLEYRVEFPSGATRRYQAVINKTDFEADPVGCDYAAARRFIELTMGPVLEEVAAIQTPEAVDAALEQRDFSVVESVPELKYVLWRRIIPIPRE
jgi:hypothetical protein